MTHQSLNGMNTNPVDELGNREVRLQLNLQRSDFELSVNVQLPAQGVTVLFGPSGSGKTTLLRCVAGLEQANGRVVMGSQVWQDSSLQKFTPVWQRDLGYVFQEASLFEHMNVQRNLEFGIRRLAHGQHAEALNAAIELLGIGHLLKRSVSSLSGGERQRVAIARALAMQPKVLLLDEPLASLDMARKKEILPWLERLHQQLNIPILYVTHSLAELARLADWVVMLQQGKVVFEGNREQAMQRLQQDPDYNLWMAH